MATTTEQVSDELVMVQKYLNTASSSKRRGIPFCLSYSEFKRLKLRKTCYYSGVRLTDSGLTQITLDRVVSSIGYTVENTVACCDAINQAKALFENQDHLNIHHLIKAVKRM